MVPVADKHRNIRRDAAVKSTRCRPTNRKKIEILSYLDTPRETTMGDGRIETRKPTTREAGKLYGADASQRYKEGKWPKMEQDLYDEFIEHRQKGKNHPPGLVSIGFYPSACRALPRRRAGLFFLLVGFADFMTLPRAGAHDSELSVKGIPKEGLIIGDYYSMEAGGLTRERYEELVGDRTGILSRATTSLLERSMVIVRRLKL
ncbi:hypothetical protein FN846DRAFT_979065 [Sphaerosporella brunnea]|uniref:Uncharacterized protein n=1 Tax=Sphaerosporella brunnea TaxID=1250544 RepID=A0A5J5ECZ2_9PEZI|nr:hypothetical protein FN846DRAFT_979065 [Sphaerosporella brunnea]